MKFPSLIRLPKNKKFNVKPSDRPQNIDVNKYLEIVNEYESLGS